MWWIWSGSSSITYCTEATIPQCICIQTLCFTCVYTYFFLTWHIASDYRINTQFITHLSDNNNTPLPPPPPRDLYKPQTTKSSQNTWKTWIAACNTIAEQQPVNCTQKTDSRYKLHKRSCWDYSNHSAKQKPQNKRQQKHPSDYEVMRKFHQDKSAFVFEMASIFLSSVCVA